MPLQETDVQELLSFAYILAVAVRGGYRVTPVFPDRGSTDMNIEVLGKIVPDGQSAVSVQVQAKASAAIGGDPQAVDFPFRLETPAYDHLRDANRHRPLLLVVLELPNDRDQWLNVSPETLIAKRCAYWCNLKGRAAVDTDTVTVRVRRRNVFNIESLTQILTHVARQQEIGE